jgi:hypothetical protein
MSVFQEVIADADLPVTIAAGVPETVVGEAPFNGTMTEAGVIPEAALVASDTLTRTLTLYNRGQAGAGTTVMATLATTTASGNWTAGDKKLMTPGGRPPGEARGRQDSPPGRGQGPALAIG